MDNIRFETIQICYAVEKMLFNTLIFHEFHLLWLTLYVILMTRYLVCLAIFSVAVDLARQVAKTSNARGA